MQLSSNFSAAKKGYPAPEDQGMTVAKVLFTQG
jgi:hypothetical protein